MAQSIRTGVVMPVRADQRFRVGQIVARVGHELDAHEWMRVKGYDTFGYVLVQYVRHEHRKYVPWHQERERDLAAVV